MRNFAFDGPVVVLPARVCAVLEQHLDLASLRAWCRDRGLIEVHDALQGLHAVALQHVKALSDEISASDAGRPVAPTSEAAPRSESMVLSSDDVANAAEISARAVTLAASKGRLRGRLVAGRWWFAPEDVAAWMATRKEAA